MHYVDMFTTVYFFLITPSWILGAGFTPNIETDKSEQTTWTLFAIRSAVLDILDLNLGQRCSNI